MKKIKKRKLKVPAALNATISATPPASTSPGRKMNVPTAGSEGQGGFGMGQYAGAAIQGAGMLVNSIFGTSNATTGSEAAAQSVEGVLKGAAAGAQFGPIGAAAGAVLGSIGQRGRAAEMTSFTDYDEGTLGTGLIGAFDNSRLRRERARIKQNAYENRAAVQGTNYLQSDYLQQYGGMDVNSFELGGMTNKQLVATDAGEIIDSQENGIYKNPQTNGSGTDRELRELTPGDRILSDSLKVPGTKHTFAEAYDKMSTKLKGNKDRYGLNSDKLNEMNNKLTFDMLYDIQERMKKQKGLDKPKYKTITVDSKGKVEVPAKDTAGEVEDEYNVYHYKNKDINNWNKKYYSDGKYSDSYSKAARYLGALDQEKYSEYFDLFLKDQKKDFNNELFTTNKTLKDPKLHYNLATDKKPSTLHQFTAWFADRTELPTADEYKEKLKPFSPTPSPIYTPQNRVPVPDELGGGWLEYDPRKFKGSIKVAQTTPPPPPPPPATTLPKGRRGGLRNTLEGLVTLAPLLNTAKPEFVDAIHNPYAQAITNVAGNLRAEADYEKVKQDYANARYNAAQLNTNTGASMPMQLNMAVQQRRANAAEKQRVDDLNMQYGQHYLNTMNNLGQQWVSSELSAQDTNLANKGAADTWNAQARENAFAGFQNWQKQRNSREAQKLLIGPMAEYLKQGMTSDNVNALMTLFNRYLG